MRINKIKLQNWRCFRSAEFVFGDMTAIRGPNGAGKSSLVAGVVYALTGGVAGSPEDQVRQGAGEAEASSVELTFSHGAADCVVNRSLPRSRRRAAVSLTTAVETVRTATGVDSAIRSLLGVDKKMIHDYIFVPQWELFSFLDQDDSVRAKAFAQLFGVERAERIWDALRDVAIECPRPSVDEGDLIARRSKLREQAADLKDALWVIVSRLQTLRDGEAERREKLYAERTRIMREADRERFAAAAVKHREELTAAAAALLKSNDELEALQRDHARLTEQVSQLDAVRLTWSAYIDAVDAARLARLHVESIEQSLQALASLAAPPDYVPAAERADGYLRLAQLRTDLENFHQAARVRRDVESLEENLVGAALPLRPDDYVDPEMRPHSRQAEAKLRADVLTLRRFLASCDSGLGVVACPTCGTPTTSAELMSRVAGAKVAVESFDRQLAALERSLAGSEIYDSQNAVLGGARQRIAAKLESARFVLATLEEKLPKEPQGAIAERFAALDKALPASALHDDKSFEAERLRQHRTGELKQATASLAILAAKVPGKPDGDQPNMSALLVKQREAAEARKQLLQRIEAARGEQAKRQIKVGSHEASLKSSEESLGEIERALAGMTALAQEERLAIEETEKTLQSLAGQEGAARSRLTENERRLAECDSDEEKLKSQQLRYNRLQIAKAHFAGLRELFHRDRLPAAVSRFYLAALLRDANLLLDRFEAPFRLSSGESLDLTADFHDGRKGPAKQMLSGGQKMIAALAFRVSTSLLFAADLGVLCLDEPTVGLDADNIRCVGLALERLKEFGRGRGLQFILITHESGLDSLCDSVIDLTGSAA